MCGCVCICGNVHRKERHRDRDVLAEAVWGYHVKNLNSFNLSMYSNDNLCLQLLSAFTVFSYYCLWVWETQTPPT